MIFIFFLESPTTGCQRVILHQQTKFDKNAPIHGVEKALWWNPKWRPPPSGIL